MGIWSQNSGSPIKNAGLGSGLEPGIKNNKAPQLPAVPCVGMRCESAVKPGSVLCCQSGNHSSRTYVAVSLKQPTRPQRGPRQRGPIWSCSGWSLPCHELLPVARCALTAPFHPYLIPLAWAIGGFLSVALVVGSRPPGVTWHPALWSPDFPPPACAGSDCLGQLTARIIRQSHHLASDF